MTDRLSTRCQLSLLIWTEFSFTFGQNLSTIITPVNQPISFSVEEDDLSIRPCCPFLRFLESNEKGANELGTCFGADFCMMVETFGVLFETICNNETIL